MLSRDYLNGADAIVVVNEACGRQLRDMGVQSPCVLWTGHADDQPPIEALEYSRERKAWTDSPLSASGSSTNIVKPSGCRAKRRACCETLWRRFLERALPNHGSCAERAPVLVYTSAPYRGLDVLLAAFPQSRRAVPGTVCASSRACPRRAGGLKTISTKTFTNNAWRPMASNMWALFRNPRWRVH
jgi:hypothetical protein